MKSMTIAAVTAVAVTVALLGFVAWQFAGNSSEPGALRAQAGGGPQGAMPPVLVPTKEAPHQPAVETQLPTAAAARPAASRPGGGFPADVRQRLQRANHGNAYAEMVSALNQGTAEGLSVVRQIAEACRAAFYAAHAEPGSVDAHWVRVLGPAPAPEGARGLADSARAQLTARCQGYWQDQALRDRTDAVLKTGLSYSGKRVNWSNGVPDMTGQGPDDWFVVLSSRYPFVKDEADRVARRYVDGQLWGGASGPEVYERALWQAVINLSVDSSSAQTHNVVLLVCAQTGHCQTPADQLMMFGAGRAVSAEVAWLAPRIQRAIEEGRIEAFRPPPVPPRP